MRKISKKLRLVSYYRIGRLYATTAGRPKILHWPIKPAKFLDMIFPGATKLIYFAACHPGQNEGYS